MRYLIAICLFGLAIGATYAQSQKPKQGSETNDSNGGAVSEGQAFSVADFRADNVIGYLGHPLGTIVRVTGKAVDGDTTRMKRDVDKTLLEIRTVNGNQLETSVLFDFDRASKSVVEPMPGDYFDYYVHEYGSFDGVVEPPDELGIESPQIAHDGFYYRRQIAIHKKLE